ncbi:MAG: glycosyl hydrolase family 18 protein, partial [Chloroflexota bacterium]|nr:glycosyl hydrolase family 18 protein [Chloroflexota bacterium]
MRTRALRLALATLLAILAVPLSTDPPRAGAAGTVRWGYYVTYAADSLTSLRANVDKLTHVSPWFYMLNGDGTIDARNEQPETTAFLRSRGVKVLPMIQNSARYGDFHTLIDTPEERDRLVAALAALVDAKGYDGIHIDFEAVDAADRPLLTDFMRRLHARLSAAHKLTTMAVAAKSSDTTTGWGGAYDYAALAPHTDLVAIMAYDYHWATGPTPGPVAPVPWVRDVARFAAGHFGAGKVVLGVPFYGLDWDTTSPNPAQRTATRWLHMADGPALAARPGATGGYDADAQANWVRYTDGGGTPREAWYEDGRSLAAKLRIVTDLGLAGFGTWRLGHENDAAWAAVRTLDTPATRVAPAPNSAERIYFPETGHTLAYGFLGFWRANGGLPVFGYPRTEEFDERNPDNGRVYTVQYFERQRFEYHPEHAGTPYIVLLGRLGAADAARRGLLGSAPFQPLPAGTTGNADCDFVPETGHRLCWGFRNYWRGHGLEFGDPGVSYREALALFGYPLSEEFRM